MIAWMNANQGATTAILTAVYVIATISMALIMIRANSLAARSLQNAKDLEQDRIRPYLIFDIITDESLLVFAELRNEGLTSAKNVQLKISPEPKTEQRNGIPCTFIGNTLSFISPGRRLRDFIAVGHHFFAINQNPKFTYNISYEDLSGKTYSEQVIIDLTYLATIQTITPKAVQKEIEQVHREIRDLKNALVNLWQSPIKVKNCADATEELLNR